MAIEFVRGATHKPVAADSLIDILGQQQNWSGRLYVGYPISRTSAGPHHIDALWMSEEKGVVAFDLVEGVDVGDFEARQEDAANKIEIRLRSESELVRRRKLQVEIHTVTFVPRASGVRKSHEQDYPVVNANSIVSKLQTFAWPATNNSLYRKALSVFDKVSRIRRAKVTRHPTRDDSLGNRLKSIEESVATLDQLQSKAVMETVEGVQRIRGLAGSGKTIVLALKAAYLHAQNPDWKLVVTFNTRSLKSFYQRLIRDFHFDQTDQEPDWENMRIVNSWGAPGGPERDGIYYDFCRRNELAYFDYRAARRRFGSSAPFKDVCRAALIEAKSPKPVYDAVLIDEAQDLPPEFLRLCYASLKKPQRLVYAYDELQNLAGESLPSPEEIFGSPKSSKQSTGSEAERDIVLEKCYRNPRPILVTAHALGFGVYRLPPPGVSTGLVQMFDHPHLWEAVGYREQSGNLREGETVTLARSDDTSPSFLEKHSDITEIVKFIKFKSEEEQAQWIAEEIGRNLKEDELRCEDIMVINPDPLTTRNKVGLARALLLDAGIQSHLAGVDTDPDVFNSPSADSVTFTGVHRAKGNEAAMVYVMNAHDCQSSALDLARIRNRLFTAITRSRAWVRVLGVGEDMHELAREYKRLFKADFELRFRYPTLEERRNLRTIHRDMTSAEKKRIEGRNRNLIDIVKDIEAGNIDIVDLDGQALKRLKQVLQKREGI